MLDISFLIAPVFLNMKGVLYRHELLNYTFLTITNLLFFEFVKNNIDFVFQ